MKNTLYPLLILFLAILAGTVLDFWKYGPYISPDTIGYIKIMQGNHEDLGTLSPFYSFILSLFPFSLLSVFDRIMVSGILIFILAIYFLYKFSKKFGQNFKYYFFAIGCTLLSWWSFRILGRAHADSHFYAMFLLWLYFFVWGNRVSTRYYVLMACLSALMVWVKLNTLFLIPLLGLWVFISKEKRWIYVMVGMLISWISYRWMLPENILDLHLSNQVLLQTIQPTQAVLFYENFSTWFQVSLGMLLSDLVTQQIPMPISFILGCIIVVLLLYYLINFRKKFEEPIYKLLLISLVYSAFFLSFQQWIGYKEINFRTLFPHLLVTSIALWIYLIQNHKKFAVLIVAFLITAHTLTGHYMIWQRNDVASLITAKKFDESNAKEIIERVLNQNHQQIFTDAPEKLMLSFVSREVLPIAPKNRFIEGKNYPLSKSDMEIETKKSMASLLNGSAIVVLFHPGSPPPKLHQIPQITSITKENLAIFYLDKSAK